MKNTFGNTISLTLFGESHGEAVGAVLDGLAPGIEVNESFIADRLSRRRPCDDCSTARREPDDFKILSGVFQGKTTGTPLCIVIPNTDVRSGDYIYGQARPSHADYTAFCKYHGCEDYRGGGHFSGRVTAAAVAAGAVLTTALDGLKIEIGTHILRCGSAADGDLRNLRSPGDIRDIRAHRDSDDDFDNIENNINIEYNNIEYNAENTAANTIENSVQYLRNASFPALSEESAQKIRNEILNAKAAGDSVGGVTQTAVTGLPAGLGEPWFDTAESMLSHALFGIGGIKGIEFGSGFEGVTERGSEFNDPIRYEHNCENNIENNSENNSGNNSERSKVITLTNHNGGINGGITNGMPVIFQCAVKPTPSILKEQDSIDFIKKENIRIQTTGRHDPAVIRRICPVIDSITALVICDMLAMRYGTDVFTEGIRS